MSAKVSTCNLLHVAPPLVALGFTLGVVVFGLLAGLAHPPHSSPQLLQQIWNSRGGNDQQSYFTGESGPSRCVRLPVKHVWALIHHGMLHVTGRAWPGRRCGRGRSLTMC